MIALPEPPFCQEPDGRWRRDLPTPPALLCGSFNPLHAGHLELAAAAGRHLQRPVAFEITAFNADKPPLAEDEIRKRLRQFEWRATVWLTLASTFAEKARLFPGTSFVVGFDTAERIIQPRFYEGESAMRLALAQVRDLGCHFLVAGRMDGERFRTGHELPLPESVRDLFNALHEVDFRLDLSATEIRTATKPC